MGYVPFAFGHYVENTGDEPLRFLEMFRSPYFADLSLEPMDGADHAEAGTDPPEPGPTDNGCPAQGQAHHRSLSVAAALSDGGHAFL